MSVDYARNRCSRRSACIYLIYMYLFPFYFYFFFIIIIISFNCQWFFTHFVLLYGSGTIWVGRNYICCIVVIPAMNYLCGAVLISPTPTPPSPQRHVGRTSSSKSDIRRHHADWFGQNARKLPVDIVDDTCSSSLKYVYKSTYIYICI